MSCDSCFYLSVSWVAEKLATNIQKLGYGISWWYKNDGIAKKDQKFESE